MRGGEEEYEEWKSSRKKGRGVWGGDEELEKGQKRKRSRRRQGRCMYMMYMYIISVL